MITYVLAILLTLLGMGNAQDTPVVIVPPMPMHAPTNDVTEEQEWSEYHAIAYAEYASEFGSLFESYTYKRTRNGRSMINGKFVKMGA